MEMLKDQEPPEMSEANREREKDRAPDPLKDALKTGGEEAKEAKTGSATARAQSTGKSKQNKNNLRKLRVERMMSKAELARRAGVSTLTIDRVERGLSCRMDTKRKILEALGLKPSDRLAVFGEDE